MELRMLVLSRRINQSITIGDEIKIFINQIKGKKVRIGINAPSETGILRGELFFKQIGFNSKNQKKSGDGTLVLSRKIEEGIAIEGGIFIELLKIKGSTVRIGIDAPADLRILRGELTIAA